MKRRGLILIIGFIIFLISFLFDNLILGLSNFGFKNILNSTVQWMLFVVVLITGLFFFYKKYKIIPLLWGGLLTSSLITWLLKIIIKRPRPFVEFTDIILKAGYSFPSGHATIAFAALPFLEEYFPRFRWYWLIGIVVIVLLRVYSGLHYLSDVIFGALVGYGISSLILFLNKKYKIIKI